MNAKISPTPSGDQPFHTPTSEPSLPSPESYTFPKEIKAPQKRDEKLLQQLDANALPTSTFRQVSNNLANGLQLAAIGVSLNTKTGDQLDEGATAIALIPPLAIAHALSEKGLNPELSPQAKKWITNVINHLKGPVDNAELEKLLKNPPA